MNKLTKLPCEICGARGRIKEKVHLKAGGVKGVNGCNCPPNKIIACKYPCHRIHIHIFGWDYVFGKYPHMKKRFAEAEAHYYERCKGNTKCSKNTKLGQTARLRIEQASKLAGSRA